MTSLKNTLAAVVLLCLVAHDHEVFSFIVTSSSAVQVFSEGNAAAPTTASSSCKDMTRNRMKSSIANECMRKHQRSHYSWRIRLYNDVGREGETGPADEEEDELDKILGGGILKIDTDWSVLFPKSSTTLSSSATPTSSTPSLTSSSSSTTPSSGPSASFKLATAARTSDYGLSGFKKKEPSAKQRLTMLQENLEMRWRMSASAEGGQSACQCGACRGTGRIACSTCQGKGVVEMEVDQVRTKFTRRGICIVDERAPVQHVEMKLACPMCKLGFRKCSTCTGTGAVAPWLNKGK